MDRKFLNRVTAGYQGNKELLLARACLGCPFPEAEPKTIAELSEVMDRDEQDIKELADSVRQQHGLTDQDRINLAYALVDGLGNVFM